MSNIYHKDWTDFVERIFRIWDPMNKEFLIKKILRMSQVFQLSSGMCSVRGVFWLFMLSALFLDCCVSLHNRPWLSLTTNLTFTTNFTLTTNLNLTTKLTLSLNLTLTMYLTLTTYLTMTTNLTLITNLTLTAKMVECITYITQVKSVKLLYSSYKINFGGAKFKSCRRRSWPIYDTWCVQYITLNGPENIV